MTAWDTMLCTLLGRTPAPLPALPGRRIVAADAPLTDDERVEVLADFTLSHADAATLLGCTRQRVHQLRQRLRAAEAGEA